MCSDSYGKIELLAPGGDVDSIKSAVLAGADAVYCGLDRFNARNRAENISFQDLNGILRFAHKNNCRVFLTLNIIIVDSEIPALLTLLNKLVNTAIDAVIVQDLGLFYLLNKYFKGLKIHASTQLTTHNEGQIKFLSKLKATRVNLSRELSLGEIKYLAHIGYENKILTEVFVHGSNCLSFSGICYMSSVNGGNSGNRGRCSQPCRSQYEKTAKGKNFPLNLKDNSAYSDLRNLADVGVYSIKIEGRIKKFHYVYSVVNAYRKQLHNLYNKDIIQSKDEDLYRVFNRDFTNGFLQGAISKDMFIDNPRDYSAIYRAKIYDGSMNENLEKAKRELYDEKTEIISDVREKIEKLSIKKSPLTIIVSGKKGKPLKFLIQTIRTSFSVSSQVNLVAEKNKDSGAQYVDFDMLSVRLKTINDTEYFVKQLKTDSLEPFLFMPFKEITEIKRKILFILNGSREFVGPVNIPLLKKKQKTSNKATLSLLISSRKDLYLCAESSADVYFQLPNSFGTRCSELVNMFRKNSKLIPWFPPVLIGKDYQKALYFLDKLQPERIVTNNTGIAYKAYKEGISWVAGPFMNIVNSFSLLCLKEKFNCTGAFISNELKKIQINSIKAPEDFKLYYSIYHPITLMTSRQCLFGQVTGCEKDKMDDICLQQCEKSSSITNLRKVCYFIEKSKGNYNRLYNEMHSLNTDIVKDMHNVFDSFFVDLGDIKTKTERRTTKENLAVLFEKYINNITVTDKELKNNISPTTNMQYSKGI